MRKPPQSTCGRQSIGPGVTSQKSSVDIDFMVAMLVGKGAACAELRMPQVNKPRKAVASIVFEIRMMSTTLIVPCVPRGLDA